MMQCYICSNVYTLATWDVPGGPQSIAIREDGTIYITTFYSDEVLRYTPDGMLLDAWLGGETLRGIEFFPAPLPTFVRGDVNRDTAVQLADAVAILEYLFLDATSLDCVDAADVNDDADTGLLDAILLLSYLFQGGGAPEAPFPQAGVDPTPDSLGCLD